MNLGQRPYSFAMHKLLISALRERLFLNYRYFVVVHHYTDIKGLGVQVEYEIREYKGPIKFGRIVL